MEGPVRVKARSATQIWLRRTVKRWLWVLCPRLFERLVNPYRGQIFSIGIFAGASLFQLEADAFAKNPVLTAADVTDVPAAFVADPSMIWHNGRWYMFFEVMNRATRYGHIGYAVSDDGRQWAYAGLALVEPFHLAYPQVFHWDGRTFMIPDTPRHGVRLYEAVRFPGEWRLCRELLSGGVFSDSTIFQHDDLWWLFAAWAPMRDAPKCLRLYLADTPLGPWREHPSSPVVQRDDRAVRPAGSVVPVDGCLVRFAQDCTRVYGERVLAFEVERLSPTEYAERDLGTDPILAPQAAGWANGGMHHVDAHPRSDGTWIACVDGWYPRL